MLTDQNPPARPPSRYTPIPEPSSVLAAPVAPSKSPEVRAKWYGIQIMGLGRKLEAGDPALKGLKAEAVKSDGSNVYKYITAKSDDKSAAAAQLAGVRKKFPEAFLVEVEGNVVTRAK